SSAAAAEAAAGSPPDSSPPATGEASTSGEKKPLKLSFTDKIRKVFLSQTEFEAFLAERELKRKGMRWGFGLSHSLTLARSSERSRQTRGCRPGATYNRVGPTTD